jgi:antitoxin (DNA-binding transcriptional repressor) of toxin-antitoxin stability system
LRSTESSADDLALGEGPDQRERRARLSPGLCGTEWDGYGQRKRIGDTRVYIGVNRMKTIDIAEATAPLADYARANRRQTLVVTRCGRPIAALMPISTPADIESIKSVAPRASRAWSPSLAA